jgi:ribulose-phosphate 3-epimerase
MSVKIAASILSADFLDLGNQVREAVDAGAEYIHVDVMDGHFVPNISFGALVVEAVKPIAINSGVVVDVHFMITNPELYISDFINAGADNITVHVETCVHLHRTIQQIKEGGIQAGVTLNPATPLNKLQEVLEYIDHALVMSVNPGFGGQKYIPRSTGRISRIKQMIIDQGLENIEIEVDGGINPSTAGEAVQAGATVLIAGSAIFNKKKKIADNINMLRKAAIL